MKFSELVLSRNKREAFYCILNDDIADTGSNMGYGTESLTITPEMIRSLEEGKIIIINIQGEYGLVLQMKDTLIDNKGE